MATDEILGNSALTMLVELEDELMGRAERIHRYSTMKTRQRRKAIFICLAMILANAMLVYAGADLVGKGSIVLYHLTDTGIEEELEEPPADDWVEYTEDAHLETTRVNVISLGWHGRTTFGGTIEWDIPGYTRAESPTVSLSSGDTITIIVSLLPAGYSLRVGIINSSGIKRYVEGSDFVNHGFLISTADTYKVFIENVGSTDAEAIGHFVVQ